MSSMLRANARLYALFLFILLRSIAEAGDSYYDILNVDRRASQETIRKSYRALARKYHPDKNDDSRAKEIFLEVTRAYEVLGDEASRKEYDQQLGRGRRSPDYRYMNRQQSSHQNPFGNPFFFEDDANFFGEAGQGQEYVFVRTPTGYYYARQSSSRGRDGSRSGDAFSRGRGHYSFGDSTGAMGLAMMLLNIGKFFLIVFGPLLIIPLLCCCSLGYWCLFSGTRQQTKRHSSEPVYPKSRSQTDHPEAAKKQTTLSTLPRYSENPHFLHRKGVIAVLCCAQSRHPAYATALAKVARKYNTDPLVFIECDVDAETDCDWVCVAVSKHASRWTALESSREHGSEVVHPLRQEGTQLQYNSDAAAGTAHDGVMDDLLLQQHLDRWLGRVLEGQVKWVLCDEEPLPFPVIETDS